jgi:hypothetical protein
MSPSQETATIAGIDAEISPAKKSILFPLSIILVSRAGLILFAYLGLVLFTTKRYTQNAEPGNLFLDGWVQWDSFFYSRIATNGYVNLPDWPDVGDLPLYPMSIRALNTLTGDVYIAGLLISNISFVITGLLLYQLVLSRWGEEIAQRTLVLLCLYPFSYAYTAMYTESLFLLCTVCTFWFAEKRWWIPAIFFSVGASATRVVGVATSAALILMYLQSIDWNWRELRWKSLTLLLGFGGLGAFVIFLTLKFHDPLAFVKAHQGQPWSEFNTFQSLLDVMHFWGKMRFGSFVSGNAPLLLTIHFFIAVIASIICLIAWRRLPIPYAAWATIVVMISYYRWGCFGRHFSTVFPAFIVLAMLLRDTRIYHGIVYLFILLLALFTLMFTHGIWVA